MYGSEQQRHPTSRPYVLAQRLGRPNTERSIFVILTLMLASVAVALWLAYLPMLAGSVLTSLSFPPQPPAGTLVNRLHKADRLGTATFAQRWNGVTAIISQPPRNSTPIPEGRNPTSGSFHAVEDVSDRCAWASTVRKGLRRQVSARWMIIA